MQCPLHWEVCRLWLTCESTTLVGLLTLNRARIREPQHNGSVMGRADHLGPSVESAAADLNPGHGYMLAPADLHPGHGYARTCIRDSTLWQLLPSL
jgi:hypothetical protein